MKRSARTVLAVGVVSAAALMGAAPAFASGFDHSVAASMTESGAVRLHITGVAKNSPVTVLWSPGKRTVVQTGCTARKAATEPLRCVGVASGRLPAGVHRITLSDRSGRATIRLNVPSGTSSTAPAGLPAGWETDMLARVNTVRADAGLPALSICPALQSAAADYATLMANKNHYGHTGPDGSTPDQRVIAAGYNPDLLGENIAKGSPTVPDVMAGWIASPSHYATMTGVGLTHVGFGSAADAKSRYWVQNYGAGSCPQ